GHTGRWGRRGRGRGGRQARQAGSLPHHLPNRPAAAASARPASDSVLPREAVEGAAVGGWSGAVWSRLFVPAWPAGLTRNVAGTGDAGLGPMREAREDSRP